MKFVFLLCLIQLLQIQFITVLGIQPNLSMGTKDFFMNCQISDEQIKQLTPQELHQNGGWDLGTPFDFLNDIQKMNRQKNKIKITDQDFILGLNQKFDTPQIIISESQQYRPQIRDFIKHFHKRYFECNYGGKLVTLIPSNSQKTSHMFQKDTQIFRQYLNENLQQKTINDIYELLQLQQSLIYILEGNNQWPFLQDYKIIQGDQTQDIQVQFGYGKKYQSTLFRQYQEQYQELIYGEKLWILIPNCYSKILNLKLQFNNIIEFILQGYLQIDSLEIILQKSGEIIYIPEGWQAATYNIGEVLYISNIKNNQVEIIDDNLKVCNTSNLDTFTEQLVKILNKNENQVVSHNQAYINNINNTNTNQKKADYIQPKGNVSEQGSLEYHIQCNLSQQELIDQMDEKFRHNGGWDPNEIYDVLKNITYVTQDVQTVELSDEEFLEGLDIDLDYPRLFKSKTHKYRPQIRDILHLFSKPYLQCSYSKRTVSLTPCFGEYVEGFKDVLFEDWLNQSEKEKHDVTMEELQELEGSQFYNLFGGTQWPFLEQNYKSVWSKNHDPQFLLGYGKSGSGVPFHKHYDVLNEVIYGQKLWFLTPPCHDFEFNNQGMSVKFFNQEKYKQKGVVVILQQPGEILYLPKFWYHSTLNIGETICVANFNNESENPDEYQHLYHCNNNIQQQNMKDKEQAEKDRIQEEEHQKSLQNDKINNLECDSSNMQECLNTIN